MLSAIMQFDPSLTIGETLVNYGFKPFGAIYVLETNERKELARSEPQDASGTMTFTFPGNLAMEEYMVIHQSIKSAVKAANASVDDSNSLLGYLPSGEGAYILTGFEAWISFLLAAKHKSMMGQKVRVIENSGRVIGEGLLMELETVEDTFFSVKKCTLVTTFGEQSFTGKNLKIEPTGEW